MVGQALWFKQYGLGLSGNGMSAPEIVAVATPVGVVIGWLAKHFANGGKPTGHQATVERLLTSIERHTAEIPMLKHVMEQHEAVTVHAREQVAALVADMEQRQRRGE